MAEYFSGGRLQAGKLRSRITIEKVSYTANATGGFIETWSTQATVWAEASHLSGRELELARQVSPNITEEFTIRYRTDMADKKNNALFRIKYGTAYYNIVDVKDLDNLHKWLYVKCEVRQSEQ